MPPLQDVTRLCPEPSRFPENKICKLAYFDTANYVAESLGDGWVDGILAHVALRTRIVSIGALVLGQEASLDFILVCCVPRPQNHLAAAAHGL